MHRCMGGETYSGKESAAKAGRAKWAPRAFREDIALTRHARFSGARLRRHVMDDLTDAMGITALPLMQLWSKETLFAG